MTRIDVELRTVLSLHRELLEPWVHYVPLNKELSDVESKMKWILENEEYARRISERATLWIQDLCFHPHSALDDQLIQEEMVRRYLAHFHTSQSNASIEAVAVYQ